jgi:hypothetical protein
MDQQNFVSPSDALESPLQLSVGKDRSPETQCAVFGAGAGYFPMRQCTGAVAGAIVALARRIRQEVVVEVSYCSTLPTCGVPWLQITLPEGLLGP